MQLINKKDVYHMKYLLSLAALLVVSFNTFASDIVDSNKCIKLGDNEIYTVTADAPQCFITPTFKSKVINVPANIDSFLIMSMRDDTDDIILPPDSSVDTEHAFIVHSYNTYVITRKDEAIYLLDQSNFKDGSLPTKKPQTRHLTTRSAPAVLVGNGLGGAINGAANGQNVGQAAVTGVISAGAGYVAGAGVLAVTKNPYLAETTSVVVSQAVSHGITNAQSQSSLHSHGGSSTGTGYGHGGTGGSGGGCTGCHS